jgi:hypothetical protein
LLDRLDVEVVDLRRRSGDARLGARDPAHDGAGRQTMPRNDRGRRLVREALQIARRDGADDGPVAGATPTRNPATYGAPVRSSQSGSTVRRRV